MTLEQKIPIIEQEIAKRGYRADYIEALAAAINSAWSLDRRRRASGSGGAFTYGQLFAMVTATPEQRKVATRAVADLIADAEVDDRKPGEGLER